MLAHVLQVLQHMHLKLQCYNKYGRKTTSLAEVSYNLTMQGLLITDASHRYGDVMVVSREEILFGSHLLRKHKKWKFLEKP
jgi:hypothetical protein